MPPPLNLAFFGSPPVSAKVLEKLLEYEHEDRGNKSTSAWRLRLVVSNPDCRRGRSSKLQSTAVSQRVLDEPDRHIVLERPEATIFRDPAERPHLLKLIQTIRQLRIDILVIFAYGNLLPKELLESAPRGAINLHASLLPGLRGASPIQSAIAQGHKKTGWSLQYINEKMDTGAIISQESTPILPDESSGELLERILPVGARLLVHCLERIHKHHEDFLPAEIQNSDQATYCHKLSTKNARIRPEQQDRLELHNFIRAYNPSPIAWTEWQKKKLRLHRSSLRNNYPPTEAKASKLPFGALATQKDRRALWLKAKDGYLEIKELQLESKQRVSAKDFLNGQHAIHVIP